MKHEQVAILLKAVRGVLADDELTKAEREDVLRETFDDYAGRTGRDGLKDIASIPAALDEPDLTKADTRHALAMTVLEGKAEALRKVNPSLTREQAFSRVYQDPANLEVVQIERAANEARFVEQATSQSGDNIEKRVLIATARQRARRPEGQGRRASQGASGAFRIAGFRQGLHGPGQSRAGRRREAVCASRFVRLNRNSMLLVAHRISRAGFCDFGVIAWAAAVCPPAVALFSLSGFDDGRIYELRRSCGAICSRSGRHRGCQTCSARGSVPDGQGAGERPHRPPE